jgi:hypothetical protein
MKKESSNANKPCTIDSVMQRENQRTIFFKNGTTTVVDQEIIEIINNRVTEGCGTFQTFSDENGVCFLIINISEISHVA